MKTIFENVIARGQYDLIGLLKRIDSYHIEGKLTDEERDELYARAREGARMENSVDIMAKLMELEERVSKLESGESGGTSSDLVDGYVPGKWYRAGDRISFEGSNYTCIAPEGQVCTWSPAEYPAYWQKEE